MEATDDDGARRLPAADGGGNMDDTLQREGSATGDQYTGMADTTMDPARPRIQSTPLAAVSLKVWRQLLGLNPFKGSYFGLYATLNKPADRLVAILGAIFAVVAGIPLPIIGVIFGKIISGFPPSPEELHTRISQLLGVAVAFFVVTSAYTIAFGRTGEKIAIDLRIKLLHSLLHVDQAYLDTHDVDVSALLREKIDTIQVGCSEKVGVFIQSMSYFVAAFAVGFILNAKLTGILFAAVIPTMAFIVYFGSTATSKLTKAVSEHTQYANAIAESALRAVKVLQAFDMMHKICNTHQIHLSESSKVGLRKAVVTALQLGGTFFTAYAANALAFYVGSHMAASGGSQGDSGTIYAVVFLILDAAFVVGQFAPFLEIFARAASAHGSIQDLLAEVPKVSDSRSKRPYPEEPDMHHKDVKFENISFHYPARPTVPVLNSLNLNIRAGAFNAIVGTSGGGKSTLVSLLLRVYDYAGEIYVGSSELQTMSPEHVRSQISVLDQDCVLLAGTIYDNICHGIVGQEMSEATRTALCKQAATAAGLDFLDQLPSGIYTSIDSTLQLSGGQKQRVCLARALIKNPAILILDEPTSALDAWSELKVMHAVQKAVANGTTVLMIAHRLSTVVDADHIHVVSDGRVVEEGTPPELSREGTIFRGLLDAQNTELLAERASLRSPSAASDTSDFSNITKDQTQTQEPKTRLEPVPNRTMRQIATTFLRLSEPEHRFILIGVCAATVSGSIILGEAIVFGNLVQLLNTDRGDSGFQDRADFFCLMFFVCALVALVSYVASGTAFGIASTRLTNRVQATLLQSVLNLDIEWFSGPGRSVHELASTFSKDSGDLACLSGVALGTIFTVITSVCGGIILAHAVAWKIAVVLLAAVPVMLVSGYIRLRMLAKTEARQRTAYSEASALAIESCRSRKTITALGLEGFCLERYRKALRAPYKAGLSASIFCNSLLAFSFAITYFVYALAYWWGAKQVRNGLYTQKDFFTVLPALLFSAQAAGQLFSLSPEIARAKTAASSIFQLLSFEPSILKRDDKSVQAISAAKELPEPSPELVEQGSVAKFEFKNVSFSYSANAEQKALDDVSLTIRNGEAVALVGPSGAGKSSILALLERFYDPVEGKILFEHIDMRKVDVRDLRKRLALVPQEPEIFPGTISYNIRLGAALEQTVTQELVEAVAKKCGLHDFISSLPDGYNTECGSMSNSRFSGGQRQRLSLARALVRDPEVLILDEPTSALDATSEQQIQGALKEASKGRTTVTVAHRLASIRDVDRIIVFDNGRVVEQGTHSELIKVGGLYASMAKAQSLA